jgi:hypothetical protein
VIPLDGLDVEECALLRDLQRQAEAIAVRDPQPGRSKWAEFRNQWMAAVSALYMPRGLSRPEITASYLYRVAQDLGNRLGVQEGTMSPPDYRDELEDLIRTRFPTQRAFCEATGISEDLLSHVLARRKHFAIDTLADALARIGFGLHITPLPEVKA